MLSYDLRAFGGAPAVSNLKVGQYEQVNTSIQQHLLGFQVQKSKIVLRVSDEAPHLMQLELLGLEQMQQQLVNTNPKASSFSCRRGLASKESKNPPSKRGTYVSPAKPLISEIN